MPKPYPQIDLEFNREDANPAIRLFGRRFQSGQTTMEFLIEMLLVAMSPKRVGDVLFDSLLPAPGFLRTKWTNTLDYAPRARLNLKLFSFFGASKLDTRHETHRSHLEQLDEQLKMQIVANVDNTEDILKTLENLFLGFHGVGIQRTWCAQAFLPICKELLASETIWNETNAKRKPPKSWEDVMEHYSPLYFTVNQHRYLARGGEVLYLQLCNALRREPEEVNGWLESNSLSPLLTEEERNPVELHAQLEKALNSIFEETPSTLAQLAKFIDREVEIETALITDDNDGGIRWTSCGWCPEETWPESYLFAVELLRICRANVDLIDRIALLETSCCLHVMRSLITQAARYSDKESGLPFPSYRFAITDPEGKIKTVKQVSRATVRATSKCIFDGIRHPDIFSQTPIEKREREYDVANKDYGHKLFDSLGKSIGFIVPRRGPGARFVLNERILQFLVVALSPGQRMTYDTFKRAAEVHFGFAFDESALRRANAWATSSSTESFGSTTDDWLAKMLEEAGALRRLSDSCALIENVAAPDSQEKRP